MRVLYVAMAENHFWVAKSGFWGEFSHILGGIKVNKTFKSGLGFLFWWSEVPFPRYFDSRVLRRGAFEKVRHLYGPFFLS